MEISGTPGKDFVEVLEEFLDARELYMNAKVKKNSVNPEYAKMEYEKAKFNLEHAFEKAVGDHMYSYPEGY